MYRSGVNDGAEDEERRCSLSTQVRLQGSVLLRSLSFPPHRPWPDLVEDTGRRTTESQRPGPGASRWNLTSIGRWESSCTRSSTVGRAG